MNSKGFPISASVAPSHLCVDVFIYLYMDRSRSNLVLVRVRLNCLDMFIHCSLIHSFNKYSFSL